MSRFAAAYRRSQFNRVQHPITYWYSGQTGGTTGAASHRQAVLLGARPRANTCPEPDRPHPPASTRSPVLVGRTGRETPKHQSPDPRPSPGTPAGGRVRPAQLPALPHPLPRGAYTKPTRYRAQLFHPGGAPHFWLRGPQYTIHTCRREHSTRQTRRNGAATCRSSTWPCHPWEVGRSRYGDN